MPSSSLKPKSTAISLQASASRLASPRALYPIDEEPVSGKSSRSRWQGLTRAQAAWQASDDITSSLARCQEIYATTLPRPPLTAGRAALRRFSLGADVLFKQARDPERSPAARALYAAMLPPTLLAAPLLGPLLGGALLAHRARFEALDKCFFDDQNFRHDARRALRGELKLLSAKLAHAPSMGFALDEELVKFFTYFLSSDIKELKLRDPTQPVRHLALASVRAWDALDNGG